MPVRIIKGFSSSASVADTVYTPEDLSIDFGELTMGTLDVFDLEEIDQSQETFALFQEDGTTGLEVVLIFNNINLNSRLMFAGFSIAPEAAKVYAIPSEGEPIELTTMDLLEGPPEGMPTVKEVDIPSECIINGSVTLVLSRMGATPEASHMIALCYIKHSYYGRDGRDGRDGVTPSLDDTYYFRDSATVEVGSLAMGSMDVFDKQEVAVENATVFAEDGSTGLEITLSFTEVRANSKLLLSGASMASEAAKVYGLNSVSAPVEIATFSGLPVGGELPELQEVAIPEECIIDGAVTLVIKRMAAELGAAHAVFVCCIKHSFQGRDGKDGKDGEDGTTPSIEDVGAERYYETPILTWGLIASGELNDIRTPKEDGTLVLEVDPEDPISMGIMESFIAEKGSKLKISAWGEGIGVFCLVFHGADANPDYIYYLPINDGTYDESSYKYYNIPDGCFSEEYPEDPIVIHVSADPDFGGTLSGTLHIAHLSVVKTYHGTDARDAYLDSLSHNFTYPRSMFPYYFGSFRNLNDNAPMSVWVGFQSEYDSIGVKNPYVLYIIKEDEEPPLG
jgi:hypothetical protein